jgi:hypothetical protein
MPAIIVDDAPIRGVENFSDPLLIRRLIAMMDPYQGALWCALRQSDGSGSSELPKSEVSAGAGANMMEAAVESEIRFWLQTKRHTFFGVDVP